MKTPQTHAGRVRGGALLWIILIIGLVSMAVFYFAPSKSAPPPTLAARTPSPSTSTSITPLSPPPTPEPRPTPEPPAATPTPAPVVRATPTPAPTPVPLDLATVARTPALWPQQIALVREVSLPIMFNGQTAGQAQVKPGTLLRLWRVSGQHVEVEFQKARHVLPVTATDLMQRALAKFATGDATSPASSLSSNTMTLPPIGLAPQTPPQRTNMEVARLARSITVEPIAKKTNKHEGGDYDDKMDRFTLRLKFTNTDNGAGAENLKAEVYIFGQSIMNTSVRKVLGVENFTFSLLPRGSHEVKTTEVTTRFDKTGARFGYEYDSWFLRVLSSTGEVVMIKASAPSLMQNAAKITGLQANSAFERSTFAAVANPPR